MLALKHWCRAAILLISILFIPDLKVCAQKNGDENGTGETLKAYELIVKVNSAEDLDSLKKEGGILARFSADTQFSNKQIKKDLDRLLDSVNYLTNCDASERDQYFKKRYGLWLIYNDLKDYKFSEELYAKLKRYYIEYKNGHDKLDALYKLSLLTVVQWIMIYKKDLVSTSDLVDIVDNAEKSSGYNSWTAWLLKIELLNKMIEDGRFNEIKYMYEKKSLLDIDKVYPECKLFHALVKIIYIRTLFEIGDNEPAKKLYLKFRDEYRSIPESDVALFVNYHIASKKFYLNDGKIREAISSQEMLFGGSLKLYGIDHQYTKPVVIELRDMLAKNQEWKEMRLLEARFHLSALPMQPGE